MALEILAGAAVRELLKIVSDASEKMESLRPPLKKLEKTLRDIDERLVEINRLNEELDISGKEMEDLIAVVKNGKILVCKCSEDSNLYFYKQVKYYKELVYLDDDLVRYFITTLSLGYFKNTKMILAKVNQMHQLMGDRSDGGTNSSIIESEENPKRKFEKLMRDSRDTNQTESLEESLIASLELVEKTEIEYAARYLLEVVLSTKAKSSYYKQILFELESSLRDIIPRLDHSYRYEKDLEFFDEGEELVAVRFGLSTSVRKWYSYMILIISLGGFTLYIAAPEIELHMVVVGDSD